jgi:hypothetical protein
MLSLENAAIDFNASNKTVISVTYFYQLLVIMVFLDLPICHVASLVAPFYCASLIYQHAKATIHLQY